MDGFFAPRSMVKKKPPHGSPCNRCGLCCYATLCPLAEHVFGPRPGPCPALSFDKDGSRCGLADLPGEAGLSAKHLIGSDTGCDARFNGEPIDVEFYTKLDVHDRATRPQTDRALKLWGLAKKEGT